MIGSPSCPLSFPKKDKFSADELVDGFVRLFLSAYDQEMISLINRTNEAEIQRRHDGDKLKKSEIASNRGLHLI